MLAVCIANKSFYLDSTKFLSPLIGFCIRSAFVQRFAFVQYVFYPESSQEHNRLKKKVGHLLENQQQVHKNYRKMKFISNQ